jgi:diaminopimelate decarboxylase
MKANPNKTIRRLFDTLGLHIDASSEYEAYRAIHAGIASYKILLTAQEMTAEALKLIKQGVQFNACSLSQLEKYGKAFPGTEVSIRINP